MFLLFWQLRPIFFHKMVQHFNPLAGSFLETESPEPHDDVGTTFERNRSEQIGIKNLSPKEKKSFKNSFQQNI